MDILQYAWLIPLLPVLGFIIIGFFGGRMKEGGAPVAIIAAASACVLSIWVGIEILLRDLATPDEAFVMQTTWLQLTDDLTIEFGIYLDNLTAMMLIFVSILIFLIFVYSIGYMHEEGARKRRYYAEVCLFATGMFGLVVASNYLEMFIFWEIMGLCSYLLIGFWNHRPSAASAAKKAFLVTRVGDVMLMTGIIILFIEFGDLNYTHLFDRAIVDPSMGTLPWDNLQIAMLLIFGGAIGKSAQFPLHDWLPDAMEGPTTVSALIHAATMVKGGVYLVARSFPLYVQVPDVLLVIAIIGGVTAIFAASMALNNMNIKRVLAYSTISQLAYMMLALGAGGYAFYYLGYADGYSASTFHMFNHAFFKALLFLCAGSVIHAVGTEDMRKMGGLSRKMKVTSIAMLVAALSISGIPPFSGFWSKDEVLASVWNAAEANSMFYLLWALGAITAFMTAFYMFRLWFMTFAGEEGEACKHAHESPASMAGPLVVLAVFAFSSGFALFIGDGFLSRIFFGHAHDITSMELLGEIFTDWKTYLSVGLAVAGIVLAYYMYVKRSVNVDNVITSPGGAKVYKTLQQRYYFPQAFDGIGLKVIYPVAKVVDYFDKNGIDGIVNGVSGSITGFGRRLSKAQTGNVHNYAAVVIAGLSVILILAYLVGGL